MRARGDRIMAGICWLLCVVSLGLAPAFGTWTLCAVAAVPLAALATLLAWHNAGAITTRLAIAFIFMSFAAVSSIDQYHGLIEMHFSVFVLLAFLLFYRDWRPVAVAAVTIAVHHYVFCALQMHGWPIFVFPMDHGCGMVWVHAAFVIFESVCLMYLGELIRKEAVESATVSALGERIATTGIIDFQATLGSDTTGNGHWSPGLQQFLQATRRRRWRRELRRRAHQRRVA